ncbi:MAG: hypothetical protein ACK5ZZ_07925, partial [Gemmatimonadaceae bacterium]
MRGIKRAVLRAADEGGLDGIAECIAPVLWMRFTGEHKSNTPPDRVSVVRQAIQPKPVVEEVAPDVRRAQARQSAAPARERTAVLRRRLLLAPHRSDPRTALQQHQVVTGRAHVHRG